ncbi:MAG: hypothetical protein HC879_11925 [Leptolyngbyaceae cyanobacterium SL_5_9]|nr:hypothetical protein [Leptolyngbyaceae cyanobacterium SL_5_9]
MSNKTPPGGLGKTLWRALTLRAGFYDNAHHIPHAQRLALTIVLLAALSQLLGSLVILLINRTTLPLLGLILLLQGVAIVVGYYFWTFTIWKLGRWFYYNTPGYRELLSPIGFAYAPQVLNFLTLIPLLGRPIELILAAWSLLAVIVAVREGLNLKTRSATLICLVGWPLIQLAIGFIQIFRVEVGSTF